MEIDITEPLRHSLLLSIHGTEVGVALRYEKLPVTYFLCGVIRHMEEQCVHFKKKNEDDFAKPYGRWFRNDVLGDNYRRSQGKCFGFKGSKGWSMIVSVHVEDAKNMINESEEQQEALEATPVLAAVRQSGSWISGEATEAGTLNGGIDIPDLNATVDIEELRENLGEIMPMQQVPREQIEAGSTLFGFDLNAMPTMHGDDGHIYMAPASREVGNAMTGLEVIGPWSGGESMVGQQMGLVKHNDLGG